MDTGTWFLLLGIGLIGLTVFALMRRGVLGQPGKTPMHDVRRLLKWAAIALAVWAVPMLTFVSLIVAADYSARGQADASLMVLPLLFAGLGLALVVILVRQGRH